MLGEAARARIAAASTALDRRVDERRRIYGVTTGYGPLASSYVGPENAEALQRNLIYHLASGVGPPLPRRDVRAIMATRLSSLALGWSGVRMAVVDQLLAMLNADLIPVVPEAGTVGASGDLTPLSHIALAMLGEGELLDAEERPTPAAPVLARCGIAPMQPGRKDALALVNGTAAMTGIAALNAAAMARAVETAMRLTVLYAEALGGRLDPYDPRFGQARPHPGQIAAHDSLNAIATGSRRLRPPEPLPPVLPEGDGVLQDQELPQDAYTLRCAPQEFGAALDVLDFHARVVETELNSATDNPLIDAATGEVLQGGNFYGQHVAYASDALASVAIKLAAHAERALARLTDTLRNGDLPPFLQGRQTGLNSGFMGAQVTATALVAEMRSKAVPAAIQTIPTNADNQDVVTMGTIAARNARDQVTRLWQVLAIHALALTQAHDLRGGEGFAPATREVAALVRRHSPFLDTDRPLSGDIARVATALSEMRWSLT